MNRAEMLRRAGAGTAPWDIVIIGGGATGVGIAIDAASRKYDVLLLERSDFGKGTSEQILQACSWRRPLLAAGQSAAGL